jgi:hypothetical protein
LSPSFRPSLKNKISIEVLSTKSIEKLFYQIIGKGKLVDCKTIKAVEGRRQIITFTPNFEMLPKVKVIIYYIASKGEIISDKIDIEFGNELINYVSKLNKNIYEHIIKYFNFIRLI